MLVDDVAKVKDSSQIQYNKVLINGQPSVYVPVLRQAGANTIAVVDGIKDLIPKVFGLPPGMKIKTLFDQSTYVRQAVTSLEHEAISGSVLASLMILIFLGKLSFNASDLFVDSALDSGRCVRLVHERIDHQHHDSRRLRARHRAIG